MSKSKRKQERAVAGRADAVLRQHAEKEYAAELEAAAYVVTKPPPEAAGFRASLNAGPTDDDSLSVALTAPLLSEPEPAQDVAPSSSDEAPAIPTGGPADRGSDDKESGADDAFEGQSIPTGAPAEDDDSGDSENDDDASANA